MEIITRELEDAKYPVGENIEINTIIAKKMAGYIDEVIKKHSIPVFKINLICRGSSGAIFATIVATVLLKTYNVKIFHIKKNGESSHSANYPHISRGYNIIIDDFIATGQTIKEIINKNPYSNPYSNIKFNMVAVTNINDSSIIDFLKEKNIDYVLCSQTSNKSH